jgi:hypothetical protein
VIGVGAVRSRQLLAQGLFEILMAPAIDAVRSGIHDRGRPSELFMTY